MEEQRLRHALRPYYKVSQLHAGTDFAAAGGSPIYAVAAGRVVKAGWSGGYGNYTCLQHGMYQGRGLSTCYGHQSAIGVSVGQNVARGQVIGRVGSTGASTGNHLHFEVRQNGSPVNPLPWLPGCLC
jgi:murein DD-endopeptidase MepM/ murein hydrolase activator NlpD